MKRVSILLFMLIIPFFSFSQEILAEVIVNYQKVEGSNNLVFETLKKDLKSYINNSNWSGKNSSIPIQERIRCAFSIVIEQKTGNNQYKGTITVQSSRPVYNSTYQTPIMNYKDNDFSFKYIDGESLTYNERTFSGNNLVDVVAYYIYLILGYDADTFAVNGGTDYFTQAQKIADYSTNQSYGGWSSFDGPKSRGTLISNINSEKNNTLRQIYYQYHRQGLDLMATDELRAKTAIGNSLLKLSNYSDSFQYYPLDIFLSPKKEEIANIFSSGASANLDISELKTLLGKISPINQEFWNKIKN